MGKARVRSRQTGETAHLYGETRYAAKKWSRPRRVIIKAEVVQHPARATSESEERSGMHRWRYSTC